MGGEVEVHDTAPIVARNDQRKEDAERRCRNREEVDRDDVADMIAQEDAPTPEAWAEARICWRFPSLTTQFLQMQILQDCVWACLEARPG
jgi:hypothetical protein